MFECDAKLSADGVPFLLHDDTLERTTTGHGRAADCTWGDLSQLDAGAWHSPAFAGEPLPTLSAISRSCLANGWLLNIELKPTPGTERHTGEIVAAAAARDWAQAPVAPLLTSFQPDALEGAQTGAPHLPRGLLLDRLWTGWLETALGLGCVAVVCDHTLWDTSSITQARSAGFRMLSYTVNDAGAANRLLALGIHGIITDRVDAFNPTTLPVSR
jgi:glycerophosphoryl diester phosphodiesterase